MLKSLQAFGRMVYRCCVLFFVLVMVEKLEGGTGIDNASEALPLLFISIAIAFLSEIENFFKD